MVLVLAFVAFFATASPAQAHDELVGTDPAAGSTLDALPAQLTLTLSAQIAPDAGASEVQVTDAAGNSLVDGAPSVQDNVLTQPLAPGLDRVAGAITVLWKVVSSDGHPISGEFSFTVTGTPGPTTEPTPTETTETTEPAEPSPTTDPTPIEEYPDMTVDWGATLLVNLFPVLVAAAVIAVIVVAIVAARRRRRGPTDPGSGTPADQ